MCAWPEPDAEGFDTNFLRGLSLSPQGQEYLMNRWLAEVRWFARNTRKSKYTFYWFSGISVVASAAIALLAGVSTGSDSEINRWAIAVLGLISAISAGLLTLFQGWPSWKRRSMTLERLKSEGRQFFVLAGNYQSYTSHQDALNAFVPRIEEIVAGHKLDFFSKPPSPPSPPSEKPEPPPE